MEQRMAVQMVVERVELLALKTGKMTVDRLVALLVWKMVVMSEY